MDHLVQYYPTTKLKQYIFTKVSSKLFDLQAFKAKNLVGKDERKALVKDSKNAAIERIWRIGGNNGYYALNWAWVPKRIWLLFPVGNT